MPTATQWLSIFVCVMLATGVLFRRRRRVHIPLMLTAFAIDLGIVLYLEIARHVIESLVDRPMTVLLVVHILLSVLVLVLYVVQVVTGIKKARGKPVAAHLKVAVVFMICRFGNLATSMMVVGAQ